MARKQLWVRWTVWTLWWETVVAVAAVAAFAALGIWFESRNRAEGIVQGADDFYQAMAVMRPVWIVAATVVPVLVYRYLRRRSSR